MFIRTFHTLLLTFYVSCQGYSWVWLRVDRAAEAATENDQPQKTFSGVTCAGSVRTATLANIF